MPEFAQQTRRLPFCYPLPNEDILRKIRTLIPEFAKAKSLSHEVLWVRGVYHLGTNWLMRKLCLSIHRNQALGISAQNTHDANIYFAHPLVYFMPSKSSVSAENILFQKNILASA